MQFTRGLHIIGNADRIRTNIKFYKKYSNFKILKTDSFLNNNNKF